MCGPVMHMPWVMYASASGVAFNSRIANSANVMLSSRAPSLSGTGPARRRARIVSSASFIAGGQGARQRSSCHISLTQPFAPKK